MLTIAGTYYGQLNKNEEPEGFGIMFYESTKLLPKAVASNSIYKGLSESHVNIIGEWKNGKFHGFGKVLSDDGQVVQGKWADNNLLGPAIISEVDGSFIYGEKLSESGGFSGPVIMFEPYSCYIVHTCTQMLTVREDSRTLVPRVKELLLKKMELDMKENFLEVKSLGLEN